MRVSPDTGMKVCCRKDCKHNGCPQETINFTKNKNTADGLRHGCKDCDREYSDQYYKDNYDRVCARNKAHNKKAYRENRHNMRARKRNHNKAHRDTINAYVRRKRLSDPSYRIAGNLRARLHSALNNIQQDAPTIELTGLTAGALAQYIESQFTQGMTWDNYGVAWHIDHVAPCAMFNLIDPMQQRVCFHYSNLEPLWAFDNHSKKDKVTSRALDKIMEIEAALLA